MGHIRAACCGRTPLPLVGAGWGVGLHVGAREVRTTATSYDRAATVMATSFDRDRLLAAFDEIGRAAAAAGMRLEIAVYGGADPGLGNNFCYNTQEGGVAPHY